MPADPGPESSVTGDDDRRAEIEAVARELHARLAHLYSFAACESFAVPAITALDRVRDARGDDEADPIQLGDQAAPEEGDWPRAARSPQDEDHEALRAAAKRVLEADMRGERDLDALNALEDAAGFTQQGQRRPEQPPPDTLGGQPPAEPPEAP